jgi:8-oxo-dGTP diphosphatase
MKLTCALIRNNYSELLVAQRSATMTLPLKWEFPGGKIDQGETAEQCIVREIKEELDIEIQIDKSLPPSYHQYPNIAIELIPFICSYVSGQIVLKEHAQFKWLNPNELLALDWAEADVPIVKNYLNLLHAGN